MLEVRDLRARHGAVHVLRGVSLTVDPGEVVAVVGANGAGKTTLARAVTGLHRQRSGHVLLSGTDLGTSSAVAVARAGVTLVPQGRRLFSSLTVAEHLRLTRIRRRPRAMSVDQLIEIFPRLEERRNVRARSLSGGEQQMLAISRAVLLGPDVLVMDEPTEGLAPSVVDLVARLIARLREQGVAVLVMEQVGGFPFAVADRVLAMDRGLITGDAAPPSAPGAHTDTTPEGVDR